MADLFTDDKAIDYFFHELKKYATVARWNSQSLLDNARLDPNFKSMATDMMSSAIRQILLIDNLLALAKLDKAKSLPKTKEDLGELIKTAVEALNRLDIKLEYTKSPQKAPIDLNRKLWLIILRNCLVTLGDLSNKAISLKLVDLEDGYLLKLIAITDTEIEIDIQYLLSDKNIAQPSTGPAYENKLAIYIAKQLAERLSASLQLSGETGRISLVLTVPK